MARPLICVLLAIVAGCQSLENEFVYLKYHNVVDSNRTMAKVVDEIADALRKIPEIEQLMHSWYRVFVRKDKIEFMLRQSRNIFKRFLTETFTSYLDEAPDVVLPNGTLTVDLAVSLNKSHITKSSELLNLLNSNHNQTKVFRSSCNAEKSLQQIFIDFYKANLSNGTRNYFTLVLSYNDVEVDDNQTNEIQPFELRRNSAMSAILSELLSQVSRDVWRCDPEVHTRGVTYDRVGNLRTLPIINMKNIGSAYSSNCSDYKLLNFSTSGHFARIYAKYGWNFSHVQLFDCQNVDTSASVCFLNPGDSSGEARIVDKPENCKNRGLALLNRNHCLCTFTNFENRMAYVNVAPVVADTDRNYVVVGARFRMDIDETAGMLIYSVEVQQARLGENGSVDQSSLEWKSSQDRVLNGLFHYSYAVKTLDLEGAKDEVVVGLQFSETRDKALFLKPLVKKFDFGTGTLSTDAEIPVDDSGCSKFVSLKNADKPSLSKSPSLPELACAKVTFGPSSFKHDRGQTTVPYIDVQEVVTWPPSPLSGAGLYYKSSKGYGGFVAMKLKTYNMAEYMLN